MNAVKSAMRAACCMLCVTITTVYSLFRSFSSSSILNEAMGSSAEGRFVEQDDAGLHGERASDAETLLLAAREPGGGLLQADP